MTNKESDQRLVQSVVRAVKILEVLSDGVDSITGISHRLKLSMGTVYRLVNTLKAVGMIGQDPISRKYFLGTLVPRLSLNQIHTHQKLILYANNEMRRLKELSKETVVLHVLAGFQPYVLEVLESDFPVRFAQGKGHAATIYEGARSKVLLSQLSEAELEDLVNHLDPILNGPNKIDKKASLLKEIEAVKEQGYAVSYGEAFSGVSGISVPIYQYAFPAALGIAGPEYRWGPRMLDFLEELKESSRRITLNLEASNEDLV